MLWVIISMWEIVGGVVRHCDIVVKIKITNFFLSVFVGDSQKFPAIQYVVHVSSSVYTVSCHQMIARDKLCILQGYLNCVMLLLIKKYSRAILIRTRYTSEVITTTDLVIQYDKCQLASYLHVATVITVSCQSFCLLLPTYVLQSLESSSESA